MSINGLGSCIPSGLRILSILVFNVAHYLTIGLPLAILTLLCFGRLLPGAGQSFAGTGPLAGRLMAGGD